MGKMHISKKLTERCIVCIFSISSARPFVGDWLGVDFCLAMHSRSCLSFQKSELCVCRQRSIIANETWTSGHEWAPSEYSCGDLIDDGGRISGIIWKCFAKYIFFEIPLKIAI